MRARSKFFMKMAFTLLPSVCFAQAEIAPVINEKLPFYYQDIVTFRGEENRSTMKLFIKIPYDELQYLKTAEGRFVAQYEVAVVILDEEDFQTDGKEWKETIDLPNFYQTNLRSKYSYTAAEFNLTPGKYRVIVGLQDLETGETMTQKTRIEVRDYYKDDLSISDVMIADSVAIGKNGSVWAYPQVNAPRRMLGSLYGYFEIYSRKDYGPYTVKITIRNAKKDRVFQDEREFRRVGTKTPIVFAIPDSQLTHGGYAMKLKVKAGRKKAQLSSNFRIHWEGVPLSSQDLEDALKQLSYIAKSKVFDKVKNASNLKKREAFLRFWRKRDPTPGTERNEMMEEYYRRVRYANANFRGLGREGWRTDMGMVYILLGPPNDVERQAFPREYITTFTDRVVKAYQIWRYHDLNRSFVFVDETGFGEYRLNNPAALDDIRRYVQ